MLRRAVSLLSLGFALFVGVSNVSAAPPRKQQSVGNVLAWGSNYQGTLGNGTTTDSYTPVPVSNLSGVVAIAADNDHSVALKSDGTVWDWGMNNSGQLGDGTTTNSTTPVQVSNLTGVVAIAAGLSFSVALKSDGTVWAWGTNPFGQLGNGTTTHSTTPVQVSNLTGVVAIAAGGVYTLALKSDGTVWGWGFNLFGQLGNGTTTNSTTPVQVSDLTGVTAIAAGQAHSLALKGDGTVWAWGDNQYGELGIGTITPPYQNNTPVQVTGLSGVAAIASGFAHDLALVSDGTVWAWGNNQDGELGNGSSAATSATPVQVSGLSGAVAVAGGLYHSLALRSDGTVWAWGNNQNGELGNGTTTNSLTPVQVNSLSGVTAIAGGSYYSMALQSQAVGAGWGSNHYGQLGNGTTTNANMPVPVSGLSGLTGIAGHQISSFALKSDGTIWAWGDNSFGELGNPTNANTSTPVTTPVPVSNISGATAIAAGNGFSLALKNDGTVWAWGFGFDGELGNGTTTNSATPVQVSNLSGMTAISAGNVHSLALKSDGTVWAWGFNFAGELGNGTTTNSSTPVQVSNLSGVTAIAAGFAHSFALKSDGTVWAWGDNNYGELGTGATNSAPVTTPVEVSGLSNVVALAAGSDDGLALKSDGTVWAWGCNYYCYFNAPKTSSNTPVQVSNLSGVTAIVAEFEDSLALTSDGAVLGWGAGSSGQLGNCTNSDSVTPVRVGNLSGAVAIAGFEDYTLALTLASSNQGLCISAPPNSTLQVGQTVSFGVTSSGSPTPSLIVNGTLPGGLAFFDNGNGIGTLSGTVAAGTVGTYDVTFTAQNGVVPNGTQATVLTVIQAGTTTALTASPSPATSSQTVTLTATVAAVAPGSGTPTGTVTFLDGATVLGSVSLDPTGTAVFTTSTLASGTHTLTASYGGDANFTASTSTTVSLEVQAAPQSGQANGNVWAWGQYGWANGYLPGWFSNAPAVVSNLSGVTAIAAGWSHSLALKGDGTVWAWGSDGYGELGNGSACCVIPYPVLGEHSYIGGTSTPVQVSNLSGVTATAIAAGQNESFALINDGTVLAWGSNLDGGLGNGTTTDSSTPVQVVTAARTPFSSATAIAAGGGFTVAIKSDQTVWAWGYNADGELGNNSTNNSVTPVQVSGLTGVVAISAGAAHSLALKSDGTVWAWGDNQYGELGNGNPALTSSSTPVQVYGLTGVVGIAAGDGFSLAVKTDGTVWAWGYNGDGQLGIGTIANSPAPVPVSNLTGVTAVAAGSNQGMALKGDGTVWEWGTVNPILSSVTPVQVSAPCGVGLKAIGAGADYSLALTLASPSPAPCITSPNSAAYLEGETVSFTVTTSGSPTPSLTESGDPLPSGLNFADNGNGTGTLSGPAATGTAKTYNLTFTAQNGVTPNATQAFSLIIGMVSSGNGTTTTGTTGNGTTPGAGSNSCSCTLTGNYVPPVKPITAGKTVAPISAVSMDANQFNYGAIDVTTSAPNGISAAQVDPVVGGIASGDTVVTIKGANTPISMAYTGKYRVIQLGDQFHYEAQNENLGLAIQMQGDAPCTGACGTSTAVRNPLQSSANGNPKYTLTKTIPYNPVTGTQANYYSSITITVTATGKDVTPTILKNGNIPITSHWDFSPDEDRFYFDSTDPTSLNPCNETMSVYDLTTNTQVAYSLEPVAESGAQFSPSGKYLVYTANVYASGCYTALTNNVQLSIWQLWGVAAGSTTPQPVYSNPYTFFYPTTPFVTEDAAFGTVGTGGFGPDYPETSFVYAYANSSSTLYWTVVNLTASSPGHPVIGSNPGVPATPTPFTTTLMASWQFSPCGDVIGLVTPGLAASQSEVTLYDVRTGQQLTSQSFSVTPPQITLTTVSTGQEVQYPNSGGSGNVTHSLFPTSCGKLNTPAGQNIEVHPTDSGTSTAPVYMTFSNTSAGETTVTSSTTAPSPATPADFKLGTPPTYYDVSTSAVLTTPPTPPTVTICINYSGFKYTNLSAIKLYHYDETLKPPAWVDATISNDPTTATACGTASSLSPFALFEPVGPVPANVTASGGTPQNATESTAFAAPLQATVTDSGGSPVSGVVVTFEAPTGGPTGNFSGATLAFVTTNDSGVAVAPPFTADGIAGSYTATAWVSGIATPASFSLTNIAPAPTLQSITVSAASLALPVGGSEPFTATGNYSDGSAQDLTSTATWTSSNPTAATISTGGVVMAATAGTTTITAAADGVSGTAALTTLNPAYSLAVAAAGPMVTDGSGNYAITVKLTNKGNVALANVTIQKALLGTTAASALPATITNLLPGASAQVSFTFSSSAGAAGSTKVLRITGMYVGSLPGGATQPGGFNLALFLVLP